GAAGRLRGLTGMCAPNPKNPPNLGCRPSVDADPIRGDRLGSGQLNPPPAAIAPRQIPTGLLRQHGGNNVEAGGAKWMTPTQPGQSHPSPGPQAEASDRLVGILRAGRQMSAVEAG